MIGLKWSKIGIRSYHDHVFNKRFEIPFLIRFHLFKLNQKQVFEWWAKSEIRSRERNSGGPKVKRYADESRDYLLQIQKWTWCGMLGKVSLFATVIVTLWKVIFYPDSVLILSYLAMNFHSTSFELLKRPRIDIGNHNELYKCIIFPFDEVYHYILSLFVRVIYHK